MSAGRFIFDLDCLRSLSVTNPFPKSLLRVLRCRHQALTKILSDLITLNSCSCSKGYKPLCRAPSSLRTSREASEVRILGLSEFLVSLILGFVCPWEHGGRSLGLGLQIQESDKLEAHFESLEVTIDMCPSSCSSLSY